MNNETLIMILIVASLILNLITLILLIVFMKKNKPGSIAAGQDGSIQVAAAVEEAGVVFCRNCGNQFDSTIKVCPSCKTPRK